MRYTLTFQWNNKLVGTAQATAVMAHEFADGFFRDQFAGRDFQTWYGATFIMLLDELCAAQANDRRITKTLKWSDATGSAEVSISS